MLGMQLLKKEWILFKNGSPIKMFINSHRSMGIHSNLNVVKNVGVVTLNSPGKVNVLNKEVLQEFQYIMQEIEKNSAIVSSVIISAKPQCFIAGADIQMLKSLNSAEEMSQVSQNGQENLQRLENSRKPVVAAIMGSCLGGGLEVALACHYRLAVKDKSTLGLPEVMLGLLPGGGGTQRLPKLIGVPDALDLALTGKNVSAEKAFKLGLVDKLVDSIGPGFQHSDQQTLQYLQHVAVSCALNLADKSGKVNRKPKTNSDGYLMYAMKINPVKKYVFDKAKQKILKQSKGLYPAPLKILEAVRAGLDYGIKKGLETERKEFGKLALTNESKGLISLFEGTTECKKNTYGKPTSAVNTIAIVGAGLMGAGITQVSIDKGYNVILKDTQQLGLNRGLSQIQNGLDKKVKRKRIPNILAEKYMSNLTSTLSYDQFEKSDIVVEAVFEELDLKKKVLQECEKHTSPDCIFATNTTAFSISEISEGSSRPQNIIGMHYFSPVDKMQLLEIVVQKETSEEALKKAVQLGLTQGKILIVVQNSPGFYTSRILVASFNEGYRMMQEGIDVIKLDKLTLAAGFPIGYASLSDEVGIDVGLHAYSYLLERLGTRYRGFNVKFGEELLAAGFTGKKSGKGIYIYNKGKKIINEDALNILKKYLVEPKGPIGDEDIQQRILLRLVNEAVLCLQEGIIDAPLKGDIGAVFGIGFPPFHGGPFRYVDTVGASSIVKRMRLYEEAYGEPFTPCQMLIDFAKDSNKKFYPR